VPQNIDGLHQRAGHDPSRVVEVHGTLYEVECLSCDDRTTMRAALDRVATGEPDPACLHCGGILKSGTVMFGENLDPDVLNQAGRIAEACDIFWAIGTSLRVEPAASLCLIAAKAGAKFTIVNADPTPYDGIADEIVREPIGVALPTMVAALKDRVGMA
jgi:NAD-dependent deacetylase